MPGLNAVLVRCMIVTPSCVLLVALEPNFVRFIDDSLCLSCMFGCDEAAVANAERAEPIGVLGLHSVLGFVSLVEEGGGAVVHIDGVGEVERVAVLAPVLDGAHHSLVVLPQLEQHAHRMLRFTGQLRRTGFIHFIYISHNPAILVFANFIRKEGEYLGLAV